MTALVGFSYPQGIFSAGFQDFFLSLSGSLEGRRSLGNQSQDAAFFIFFISLLSQDAAVFIFFISLLSPSDSVAMAVV